MKQWKDDDAEAAGLEMAGRTWLEDTILLRQWYDFDSQKKNKRLRMWDELWIVDLKEFHAG